MLFRSVGCDDKSSLVFRDIWSEVFGLKSGLRNTYYKVCRGGFKLRHSKILKSIQEKAKDYFRTYSVIQEMWKEIQSQQKEHKI